jgi:hypothetical protein
VLGNRLIKLKLGVNEMNILSLRITTADGVSPIYEVHTWAKAEEIIKATQALTQAGELFTWEVSGSAKGTNDADEVAYGDTQAEIRLGLR